MSTGFFQIDESWALIASPTSPSVVGYIDIDGNPDFDDQADTNNWPGTGTANDPYIIADYYYQLSSSSFKIYRSGATIRNTDRHFILQNCVFHYPVVWDMRYGGFLFENVDNGKIIGGSVRGTPELKDGLLPSESGPYRQYHFYS